MASKCCISFHEICDSPDMLADLQRTSKQKADVLKQEIHNLLNANLSVLKLKLYCIRSQLYILAEVTGDNTATMQYVCYEEEIVLKRGVKLIGWTYDNIVNPSTMSSAIQPLHSLHDVIKQGQCHFMQLSPQEVNKLKAAYEEKVHQGQVLPHQHKPHNDKDV